MSAAESPKPNFVVVTDSTADIPVALAAERNIVVVPLSVTFGDETFKDGELTQAEFFERMNAAPQLPSTSQPPVGTFIEVYEHILASADHIISLHISSKLSGTIEAALQAAERFPGRVDVFDSRNLSMGLAFQALDAAASAAEGLTPAAAISRLEVARERVKMLVGLDSLKNLAKGGRIGQVSAFLGALLDLKVTLTVDAEGKFQPLKRLRGEKAALRYTLEWVAEQMNGAKRGAFAITHAMSPERAEWLRAHIEQQYQVSEMHICEAGIVVATHVGTAWGVTVRPA
ncbi:MAG: DegV family protein [Coriobacteriia bacterium]|nr:DegV family protein [Coriobacteriia bacterium]